MKYMSLVLFMEDNNFVNFLLKILAFAVFVKAYVTPEGGVSCISSTNFAMRAYNGSKESIFQMNYLISSKNRRRPWAPLVDRKKFSIFFP